MNYLIERIIVDLGVGKGPEELAGVGFRLGFWGMVSSGCASSEPCEALLIRLLVITYIILFL